MKWLSVMLWGLALITPALAQDQRAQSAYSASAQLMNDGQYRAEVWRRDGATGRNELAWNNAATHATMTKAMDEACTALKQFYDPTASCTRAARDGAAQDRQVERSVEKPAADGQAKARVPDRHTVVAAPKKALAPDRPARMIPRKEAGAPLAAKEVVSVKPLVSPPASGYQVGGCPYYTLVEGRVVQPCTIAGRPGERGFWKNYDMLIGGPGGSGGGGSE